MIYIKFFEFIVIILRDIFYVINFINRYSFPTPCSLLPTPYSLLPTPYSLLPIPYSLFPKTNYSLLYTSDFVARGW
ncbi:MAG: hypothetical protein F6J90_14210 [Moorea sp. SIOASIH]|nr:hypothetical protein [Moorena sp. SIOASIH]